MHVLPLEIQHSIFLLACTDGGRTGRALSLTSRSYRVAVRPVRLHTVAVHASSHIESVLQSYRRDQVELEASGSSLKPRVQHLLLSPADKGPDGDQDQENKDATESALIALLQLVGPTLKTLAYTAPICFTTLGGICPMLKLEELTVFLNPRERQPESQLDRARPPASYPALRKLHIVLSWGDVVVPDLLGWWSKAAPDVTDIRVTNVGRSDGGRDWLESMIDEDRTKRPYPSVRHMFVEPYQKPVGGRCATPRAQHKYFMREMKRLRRRAPEDVEFVLKGRETKGQPLDRVADVERYWMDSVNEGQGGWRLRIA